MRTYELDTQVCTKAMDTNTSKYWTICIITNSHNRNGKPTLCYKQQQSQPAEKFFKDKFPQISIQTGLSKQQNQYVQANLWKIFHNQTLDLKQRALAGLCLRCYVSHAIVTGCQLFANKSSDRLSLLESLLSYILNDDGKTLIVPNCDNKNQLIVSSNSVTQPIEKEANFFSVEIISTYKPNISGNKNSESLDNWSIRLIKQNNKLQPLLLEYGAWTPNDWSLLLKKVPQSLENSLQNGGRDFIEVFHLVYRRDRRKYLQKGRCSEPTQAQLEEMLDILHRRNITLNSTVELIQKFKEIAEILRQDKYSRKTGSPKTQSIDVDNSSENSNDYFPKAHQISSESLSSEDVEENELREWLNQLAPEALFKAISLKIPERVELLKSKKNYSEYADKFVQGLQLLYHKTFPKSLNEIAKTWGINCSKVRRIFQLRELIKSIQCKTEVIFISQMIDNKGHLFASEISSNPNRLQEIGEEVSCFLDNIIFKKAIAEITCSRTFDKSSLFADELRKYVNHETMDAA